MPWLLGEHAAGSAPASAAALRPRAGLLSIPSTKKPPALRCSVSAHTTPGPEVARHRVPCGFSRSCSAAGPGGSSSPTVIFLSPGGWFLVRPPQGSAERNKWRGASLPGVAGCHVPLPRVRIGHRLSSHGPWGGRGMPLFPAAGVGGMLGCGDPPGVASGFCFPAFCSPALEQGWGLSSSWRSPGLFPAASSQAEDAAAPRIPQDTGGSAPHASGVPQVRGPAWRGKPLLPEVFAKGDSQSPPPSAAPR